MGTEHISDDAVLQRFAFRPEELQALFLLPLLRIAWAEGSVQDGERRALMRIATRLGVTPRHPFFESFQNWLSDRPAEAFFERSFELLREFLTVLPAGRSHELKRMLELEGMRVALAAPDENYPGTRVRVTPEERDEIARIFEKLSVTGG